MGQTFSVTGLQCQSCVNHVISALEALDGVETVSVDLNPGGVSQVHVRTSRPLRDDDVQETLAEEGDYSLLR